MSIDDLVKELGEVREKSGNLSVEVHGISRAGTPRLDVTYRWKRDPSLNYPDNEYYGADVKRVWSFVQHRESEKGPEFLRFS